MLIGISTMIIKNSIIEQFGYILMSRGSIMLIMAYLIVFISGLVFWEIGPYRLKEDKWFLISFLLFYIIYPFEETK